MQTVKMYQLERNLGQLCDRNRKRYGGSPCLQIQLAYTMHLSEIVVVSFTHLKRYDSFSYIQRLYVIQSVLDCSKARYDRSKLSCRHSDLESCAQRQRVELEI